MLKKLVTVSSFFIIITIVYYFPIFRLADAYSPETVMVETLPGYLDGDVLGESDGEKKCNVCSSEKESQQQEQETVVASSDIEEVSVNSNICEIEDYEDSDFRVYRVGDIIYVKPTSMKDRTDYWEASEFMLENGCDFNSTNVEWLID